MEVDLRQGAQWWLKVEAMLVATGAVVPMVLPPDAKLNERWRYAGQSGKTWTENLQHDYKKMLN